LQALQQVGAGGVGARRIAAALQTHVIQAVQAWRQPRVAQSAVQLRAGRRRKSRTWWEG
jgi:hypothetical protein